MSRAKNPKYESMSLEELKANMEKSRKQIGNMQLHNKNLLEQRKKMVEAKRNVRIDLICPKGAEV